jgi:hypothetical protein
MPQCSVRKFCKAEKAFADIQLLEPTGADSRMRNGAALTAPRRPTKSHYQKKPSFFGL